MRIYKVKKLENREPLEHKLRSIVPRQKYTSKKVRAFNVSHECKTSDPGGVSLHMIICSQIFSHRKEMFIKCEPTHFYFILLMCAPIQMSQYVGNKLHIDL